MDVVDFVDAVIPTIGETCRPPPDGQTRTNWADHLCTSTCPKPTSTQA